MDLDERGHVVGSTILPDLSDLGWCLRPDGALLILPRKDGTDTQPIAVNNAGLVVGHKYKDGDWRGYTWTEVEGLVYMPPLKSTSVMDVNEHGVVLGTYDATFLDPRAFFFDKARGVRKLDGIFSADQGYAQALNDLEHFVGRGRVIGHDDPDALFWSPETGFFDLNKAKVTGGQDWVLNWAWDINNKGQIVGWGKYQGRNNRFLLTPKSQVQPPERLDVLVGKTVGGGVGSLAAKDGDVLKVARFVLPNKASQVRLEVEATLPADPWYLWLRTTYRTDAPLGQGFKAELYDRARGVWDSDFALSSVLRADWQYAECVAHRRAKDFCDAGNTVKARLTASLQSPSAAWTLELDEAALEWVKTP